MAHPEQSSPDDALGDRLHVFQPMMATIIAGGIISLMLIAGGLAAIVFPLREVYLTGGKLPFAVKTGMSWLVVVLGCLMGVGFTSGGIALAVYCRRLFSHRVESCVNGFRYCSRSISEEVLWTDVAQIKETILYQRPPILKGMAKKLLPEVASTSYTVRTKAGKEYCFNGDSIKSIKRFGRVLREHAARLSLPWETVEEHE